MNYNQTSFLSHPQEQRLETLMPFQVRFENALKSSVTEKCSQLNNLINESLSINIKEIQQRFVLLVEDIFSFQYNSLSLNSDWRLKELSLEKNPREFNLVYEFLYSNGPIFSLIRQLIIDPNNRFDFPINCLPFSTRTAFHNGFISNLYSNKIDPSSSKAISLNAFEFYIFHFAFYITKPNKNIASSVNAPSNGNALYYLLLGDYLENFLPSSDQVSHLNNQKYDNMNESSSIWKSLSSTTSNILHLGSKHNETNQYQMQTQSNNDSFAYKNPSTLFNTPMTARSPLVSSKILLNKLTPPLNTSVNEKAISDNIGSVLYKCETMLNIFTEIWFNNSATVEEAIQINERSNFNLTVENMKAIRIFLKHLHYFVNSAKKKNYDMSSTLHTQYNSGGIIASSISDPIDDLKRNLWSGKHSIKNRLYNFFRQVFDRWPNDLSFRVPLETWLSYIQPWRYTNKSKTNTGDQSGDNLLADPSEWNRFFSENLLFYTSIFRQVITRITKMLNFNLSSSSFLLYRVTKVFSQNHFVDCLKEAEMTHLNGQEISFNSNRMNNTPHNLLSPSFRQQNSQLNTPYKNVPMESESVPYVSIFSHTFRDQIIDLLHKLTKSICTLEFEKQAKKEKTNNFSTGFIASFCNFFEVSPNSSTNVNPSSESCKTKQYLEHSIEYLTKTFDIQAQCIQTMMKNEMNLLQTNNELDFVDSAYRDKNIYEIVDGMPKLSETGRSLILNGTLKCPTLPASIPQGNPDLRTPQSWEIGFLVRITLWLSMFLNNRYGENFARNYYTNTLYGIFLKEVLSPPLKYVHYVKSRNGLKTEMKVEILPPRVNLRFLASRKYHLYLSLLYLFSYFFNLSLVFLFTLIFVMYASYIVTRAKLFDNSSN